MEILTYYFMILPTITFLLGLYIGLKIGLLTIK